MDLTWYEIVIGLLGAVGGSAGVAAFIKAFLYTKQERESKEITNENSQIANLHAIIEENRNEYKELKKEFKEYKEEVDIRVSMFKGKFELLENKYEQLRQAVFEAYRCQLPATIDQCPVVQALKQIQTCEECQKQREQQSE